MWRLGEFQNGSSKKQHLQARRYLQAGAAQLHALVLRCDNARTCIAHSRWHVNVVLHHARTHAAAPPSEPFKTQRKETVPTPEVST